jgi:hypothetical protein
MKDKFLLPCTIERGGFTSERTFELQLDSEDKLVGTAYFEYLLDERKRTLDEDTPGFGSPIKGFVVCRKIADLGADRALVEVPSADVIQVPSDDLVAGE